WGAPFGLFWDLKPKRAEARAEVPARHERRWRPRRGAAPLQDEGSVAGPGGLVAVLSPGEARAAGEGQEFQGQLGRAHRPAAGPHQLPRGVLHPELLQRPGVSLDPQRGGSPDAGSRSRGAAPSLPRRVPRKCVAPETWRFHVVHDVEEWDPERHLTNGAEIPAPDEVVWARFEPFVLHVACRSLGTALGLVEASRRSFPRSSLLSFRRRFVVQIPGEDYVDLPYFFSARELNAPDRETFARYVASVMEDDKFEANARRIRTLEADLAHLASGGEQAYFF
ncbi:unnamed protein product, partial [Effrenium voratum]